MYIIGLNSVFHWLLKSFGICVHKFSQKGKASLSVYNFLWFIFLNVTLIMTIAIMSINIGASSQLTARITNFLSVFDVVIYIIPNWMIIRRSGHFGTIYKKIDKLCQFVGQNEFKRNWHISFKLVIVAIATIVTVIDSTIFTIRGSVDENVLTTLLQIINVNFGIICVVLHLWHYVQFLGLATKVLDAKNVENLSTKLNLKLFYKVRLYN